ncbi:hypothetical protein [Primorskyibacter sp. S187A]|uniref:hypothetical protein n=1 Tax=Primorskyibacter sp. S187A TaxID=3415130 RepID=UPI003C7DE41A
MPLVAAALLSAPTLTSAQTELHECDTYAAHPNDPNRWAAGVLDDEIVPGPAVKYCIDAVETYPEEPRFQFQLGRALWAANLLEDGTAVFLALEEGYDYGPVYAYLADAFYFGIGGVEIDEEFAVSLYEIAAGTGFEPALAALDELAGITEDVQTAALAPAAAPAQQVVAAPAPPPEPKFNPASYSQPGLIRALYDGNLKGVQVKGFGKSNYAGVDNVWIYLAAFHGEFAGSFNIKDPSCVQLYDVRLDKRLKQRVIDKAFGNDLNIGLGSGQVPTKGFEMMGQMLQDLTQGGMGRMVAMEQNAAALQASGAQDGGKLIIGHGCQSQVTQRIYANLRAYVTGSAPELSDDLRKSQERQKEQQAKAQEAKRQRGLRTSAESACTAQFKRAGYCGCLVKGLDTVGLDEAEWTTLGRDFKQVLAIGKSHDGFADLLKSCRSG